MKMMIFFIAMMCFSSSCDNCKNDGCPPRTSFFFEIVDTSKKNLYLPPDPIFHEDSLKVLGMVGSEQIDVPFDIINSGHIAIPLNLDIEQYFVTYNPSLTDTLNIEYDVNEDECCGKRVGNFSVNINGKVLCSECEGKLVTIVK